MKFYAECRDCLLKSQMRKVRSVHTEEEAEAFYAAAVKIADNAPQEYCAPLFVRDLDAEHRKMFGCGIDYSREKSFFNSAMLALEGEVLERSERAEDPIVQAIKFAMAGNYIDFARLTTYDRSSVEAVFAAADRATVSVSTESRFKNLLSRAETQCYLHANCGGIDLDKVLIKVIKRAYPQLNVYSIVRGGAIINDVTETDAAQVGLGDVAEVVSSGAAVPGTWLKAVNERTRQLIGGCDVRISKGLGNAETLYGAGYDIFYMCMAKCVHMAERFGVALMDTVFCYGN